MSNTPQSESLLSATELVVRTNRETFFHTYAIDDPSGAQIGSAREEGSAFLRALNTFSDQLLFPCRPIAVSDSAGDPVLWIERQGLLRRHIATVRRSDRKLVGRLVGKTWASAFRHTGYWIEVDGQRVGEMQFEKPEYRMMDTAGRELARVARHGESRTHVTYAHTSLHTTQHLDEPLASLAIAAMIVRHDGA